MAGGALVLIAYGVVLLQPIGGTAGSDGGDAAAQRWLKSSRDAFEAGRYRDALEPTIALTGVFPTQQVYAERLALIYQHLGRPVDEAEAWERVVAVSPTPVDACPALPKAYVRATGLSAKALDAFERCLGFDPKNTDMLFYLGQARERSGRADLAESTYQQAVQINPGDTDSRLGLARLALRAGRTEDAARVATTVLDQYPNHSDALLIAGLSAQRSGRGVDARKYLERALAVSPDSMDVHLALGVLDYGEGHVVNARHHFERAAQLDPARRAEVEVWLDRTAVSHQ